MNKINNIKTSNLKQIFSKQKANEVKNMKQHIEVMVKTLLEKAKDGRALPNFGDFSPLYTEFKNPNPNLCATDFLLKIVKPHNNIKGHETLRNLELVAYKLPSPYIAEKLLASGTTDEILKELNKPELLTKIEDALESLSKSLDDI
jgi:hypothetical protein